MHANYTPTCKEWVAAIAVSWSAKTNADMHVTGLSAHRYFPDWISGRMRRKFWSTMFCRSIQMELLCFFSSYMHTCTSSQHLQIAVIVHVNCSIARIVVVAIEGNCTLMSLSMSTYYTALASGFIAMVYMHPSPCLFTLLLRLLHSYRSWMIMQTILNEGKCGQCASNISQWIHSK